MGCESCDMKSEKIESLIKYGEKLLMERTEAREELDKANLQIEDWRKALEYIAAGDWSGKDQYKDPGPEETAQAALALKRKQEPPIEDPQPIGVCKRCQIPVYTEDGFCGVCGPGRA